MGKLFKGLKKGLEEALAHVEGKITLKSEVIEIPEPPAENKAEKTSKESGILNKNDSLRG